MGRSKDLATGETRFANVSGDTFTGNVGIGGAPNKEFHVRDDNSFGNGSRIVAALSPSISNGQDAGLAFGTYSPDDYWKQGIFWERTGSYGLGHLHFANRGTADTTTVSKSDAKMTINASGAVTTPAQPGWHGTHSDAYGSSYSAGQAHNMQSSLEKYNVGNHFDYTNNRFTCPVTGYYLLYGWDICIDSSSVYNSGNAIGCWKNTYSGANRLVSVYRQYNRGYSFTGTAYLAANDYVTFGNSESSIGAGAYYGSWSYSGYGIRLIA